MIYLLPAAMTLLGLVVLMVGGELLVRAATALAARAGVSPLVIGLTVVAFGTSAPELAVSLQSSFAGQVDVAVGNIVGSNIANILLILGMAALCAPLTVSSQLVRWDVPLMILASCAFWVAGLDQSLTRMEGLLFFGCLLLYVVWSIRASRRESRKVQEEFQAEFGAPAARRIRGLALQVLVLFAGLVLLTWGAKLLVDGASDIARLLGVSELVIGLSIVAIGTSMPEVATSLIATYKGERDIAVGNVVGSNLFNILCVLGLSSIIAPEGIPVSPVALEFDIPVMTAVAVACLPIFFSGRRIARWEGGMFLGYYVAYLSYLAMTELGTPIAQPFRLVMTVFVIPLTVITILIGFVRSWKQRD